MAREKRYSGSEIESRLNQFQCWQGKSAEYQAGYKAALDEVICAFTSWTMPDLQMALRRKPGDRPASTLP